MTPGMTAARGSIAARLSSLAAAVIGGTLPIRVGAALAFAENRTGVDQILAVRPDAAGGSAIEPSRKAWNL